jgi:hypothetical protein
MSVESALSRWWQSVQGHSPRDSLRLMLSSLSPSV